MAWEEVLGLVAGAAITAGFFPQVWRLFRLKSAKEISLPFTILLLVGMSCWLAYGATLGLLSVIMWNAITLVLALGMLYAKTKYGGQ